MTVRLRTIWFCEEAEGGRLSERTRERSSRREEVVVSFWERVRRAGEVIVVVCVLFGKGVDVMICTECEIGSRSLI